MAFLKVIRFLIILQFIAFSISLHAESAWICEEASSIREGHSIIACGIGEDKSLEEARRKSRESAIEEFNRICNISNDCFDFENVVIPLRTNCTSSKEKFICFRGIRFDITNFRKSASSNNTSLLDSEVLKKRKEIDDLESKIHAINQLKETNHG